MFRKLLERRRLHNTMTNINTQAELIGEQRRFGKIFTSSYSPRLKRYKEILFENGIRQVIFDSQSRTRESLQFDRLTVLILPNVENLIKLTNSQVSVAINREYRAIVYPAYINIDETCQKKTVRNNNIDIPILDYYPTRNLIILYFNPFPITPRTRQFESVINTIITLIGLRSVSNLSSIPEQSVIRLTPEEQKKQNIKTNVDAFINNVKSSYAQLQKDIQQRRKDIEYAEQNIVNGYKDIELKGAQLESVKKIVDGVEGGFEEKVNELKALPFIKDVEILKTGIKLDYGEIYIDDTYIGKIYCIISPTQIKFFNIDNMRGNCAHPHITGGNPCFGNSSNQAYKLLGQMDFKQLGFLIGQFLRTYSLKGHPYANLSEWKKENKNN